MTDKIQFNHVSKVFKIRDSDQKKGGMKEFTAINNVHFSVKSGEFLSLVGPSGCGKSTLLDLLGGLAKPTSGSILVNGEAVTGPALDRGIVFQQYALLPWRTAQGNVEFGLEAKGIGRRERPQRARDFLD